MNYGIVHFWGNKPEPIDYVTIPSIIINVRKRRRFAAGCSVCDRSVGDSCY